MSPIPLHKAESEALPTQSFIDLDNLVKKFLLPESLPIFTHSSQEEEYMLKEVYYFKYSLSRLEDFLN